MTNDVADKVAHHDISLPKKKKKETLFPQPHARWQDYDTKGFTI